MSWVFVVVLLVFIVHLVVYISIGRGLHTMQQLRDLVVELPENPPLVSIIVPACNEAKTITKPLLSLLELDYPNLEIIVIDDRSTDDTLTVLKNIQQNSSRSFTLFTITDLPDGWLGKSHALMFGAAKAQGEFLLFTDADIEMERSTLDRAVTVFCERSLDHLCLLFEPRGGNGIFNGLLLDSALGLLSLFQPWRVGQPGNRNFIGVGAFNMVRTSAYNACGGHSSFSMHPIDDIMLGKVIKEHGFKQACLLGQGLVAVDWYGTVSAMCSGLMKNSFAVFHFRALFSLLTVVAVVCLHLVPLLGAVLSQGYSQLLCITILLLRVVIFGIGARLCNMSIVPTMAASVIAPFISMYILARATLTTLWNKGISWRGTHYPLDRLRAGRKMFG